MQRSGPVILTRFGPQHWLISGHGNLHTVAAALDRSPPSLFTEWTMGSDSLLLGFEEACSERTLRDWLEDHTTNAPAPNRAHHDIAITYNGEDLAELSESLGLSESEIVTLHSAPLYTVRFLGFAPGFAYLDGLPSTLHVPRRTSPRPRIPAGSVAIGGPHAGIYPIESPGGWHLLGQTSYPLFKPDSSAPFTLSAGDTIRFVPA